MPATDWKEDIAADEPERFERYAAMLGDLQKRAVKNGTPSRALEFMTLVRVSRPPALLPVRLIAALGFRRGVQIIKSALAGLKAPQSPLAGTSYESRAADPRGTRTDSPTSIRCPPSARRA